MSVPATMTYIDQDKPGGPETLKAVTGPVPQIKACLLYTSPSPRD